MFKSVYKFNNNSKFQKLHITLHNVTLNKSSKYYFCDFLKILSYKRREI